MKGREVDEEAAPRAGRARRDRLPRNQQRERVLQMVRDHDGAVDAVELASLIGLHVTTVRFHLDALCDNGAITRTRMNRPGAGRPRTGYLAAGERVDYRALAEVLAMELGQTTETRSRRAQHAGKKWAARMPMPALEDAGTGDALAEAAARTTVAFTWMGFAPELIPAAESSADGGDPAPEHERTILLHACPVRDLARSRPEVVCGMHLGLMQGLLDKSVAHGRRKPPPPAMSAHLEPFVESEMCLARLVAE
jgi:predicted ArsR family transcriptional regulator